MVAGTGRGQRWRSWSRPLQHAKVIPIANKLSLELVSLVSHVPHKWFVQLCQIRVVLLSKFSQFVRFALSVSVWTWVEDVGVTKLFWGWTHGLHSVPSLKQLHVHVMTLDLNSPCMKMLGCSKVAGKNKHTMACQHCAYQNEHCLRGTQSTSDAQLGLLWSCPSAVPRTQKLIGLQDWQVPTVSTFSSVFTSPLPIPQHGKATSQHLSFPNKG